MCIFSLMSLVLLMILSELFSDLTRFAESNTSIATIMVFLMYSIPKMINLILPFSVCLGILATQASLSRYSETIAMQACSVSLAKIYTPYIIIGLTATIVMGGMSFYIYPMAQQEANRIWQLTIKKSDVAGSFTVSGGRFKVGQDIYNVGNLNVTEGTMESITCYRFTTGRLSEVIKASNARWNGSGWIAKGLTDVRLGSTGIGVSRNGSSLPLDRKPEELVMAQTNTEILALPDLNEYLTQMRANGTSSPNIETMYHSRISFIFAPLIITLLVIPFGMRFPRSGGIAKGIILGMILGLSYWLVHSGMTKLGSMGMAHPVVASWSANFAAIIIAFNIIFMKRRAVYG